MANFLNRLRFQISMAEPKKVTARVIIEVVGKPEEHVKKALEIVIKKIKEEEGIKVKEEKSFKPKEVDKFFSTFAELVIEFKNPNQIISFCFDYMPSSIEIIDPEELALRSNELAGLLNDLLTKLHSISMRLANINAENQILRRNTEGLLKNLIMTVLEKPRTIEELSKAIGIDPKELEPYIEGYVKKGKIKKTKDKYTIINTLN